MKNEIENLKYQLKICLDYIDDCEDELESNGLLDEFIPLTRPFGVTQYRDAKKAIGE